MAKNLGQVAGLYIGSSAPDNTALIWYDTTTHVHKTFDVSLNAWTVLEQTSISAITYSELVTRAGGSGLTQGQWFKITDRSDALALAITGTKIQYANNNGVLIVDDLGTHVSYAVTSESLIIDDVAGVYDASTNQLVFSFSEAVPTMDTEGADADFLYGVQKRDDVKTHRKFRLSSFLSSVLGNDLSWNGGFFFNFYNKLVNYFNVSGGVATHEALEEYKAVNNQAIEGIVETVQEAMDTFDQKIEDATTDEEIYDKQLPTAPEGGTPIDIAQYDTLTAIVNKIYRWINRFKTADGVDVPPDYAVPDTASPVNNNDNVSTALGKLSAYADKHETGEGIAVGKTAIPTYSSRSEIAYTDNLKTAVAKLIYLANHIRTEDLEDAIITADKMNKSGNLLPTEFCKTWFNFPQFSTDQQGIDFSGLGMGFCLMANNYRDMLLGAFEEGVHNGTDDYPLNSTNGISPWVLSFCPVVGRVSDRSTILDAAAPVPRYKGFLHINDFYPYSRYRSGARLQIIFKFTNSFCLGIEALGYNRTVINFSELKIFGVSQSLPSQRILNIAGVTIIGINLPHEYFENIEDPTSGNMNIIVKGTIEFITAH